MKLIPIIFLGLVCLLPFTGLTQLFSVRELVHIYERQGDYDYLSKLLKNKSFVRIKSDSLTTYIPNRPAANMPVEKLILFRKYQTVQYLTDSYDIYINWGYELRKLGYTLDDTYANKIMPTWKFTKGDVWVFVAEVNGGKYYALSILPPFE